MIAHEIHDSGYDAPVHRRPRAEYWFYFTVIFIASLPFALIGWLWSLIRGDRAAIHRTFVHRALSEARAITPIIFSA